MTFGKSRLILCTQKSKFFRTLKEEVEKMFKQAASRLGVIRRGGCSPSIRGGQGFPRGKNYGSCKVNFSAFWVTREVILARRIAPLFTPIWFILYCMFVFIQFGCCEKTTKDLFPYWKITIFGELPVLPWQLELTFAGRWNLWWALTKYI